MTEAKYEDGWDWCECCGTEPSEDGRFCAECLREIAHDRHEDLLHEMMRGN